jgi:hypothetical protein
LARQQNSLSLLNILAEEFHGSRRPQNIFFLGHFFLVSSTPLEKSTTIFSSFYFYFFRLATATLLSLVLLAVSVTSIEIDDSVTEFISSSGQQQENPFPIALPPILPVTNVPTTTDNSSASFLLSLTNDQVRWAVDLAVTRLAGSDTSRKFVFKFKRKLRRSTTTTKEKRKKKRKSFLFLN